MEICENGHDAVVYTHTECPVCEAEKALEGLEEELTDRDEEIERLENELTEAQTELEKIRNSLSD